MRMICPNCGAQYEVDADVIPEAGRDVQCSSCGHTWFQKHARHDEPVPESNPVEEVAAKAEAPAQEADDDETSQPASEPVAETADETTEQTAREFFEHSSEQPTPEPQKQVLDEGVSEILREEAARETAERTSESSGLETQTDLGLNQSADSIQEAATHLDEAPDEAVEAPATFENSRRDLLPDIEEINSTLAASSEAHEEDEKTAQEIQRRSGFRRGFSVAIVIFSIMALVYVFSPNIARAVPQTASALSSYVDWINELRTSVDGVLLKAVDKLTTLLAQLSGE